MPNDLVEAHFMGLLECLLLRQRIDDVASDYVKDNTTAEDAKAEVEKYQVAIFDGTAVLNMTPEQRLKIWAWLAEQEEGSGFESWFTEWEKQAFGI